jgi:hypothetical protein
VKAADVELLIACDLNPLRYLLAQILRQALKLGEFPFDIGKLGPKIARFECDRGPAGAHQLIVRGYPSDALLDLAAAGWARATACERECSEAQPER